MLKISRLNLKAARTGLVLLLFWGTCANAVFAQKLQLATPVWPEYNPFFSDKTEIALRFDMPGAQIHISTDGSIPTTASPVFKRPFSVNRPCTVKAVAVHPDFLTSEVAEFKLIRIASDKQPSNFKLQTQSDPKYPVAGAEILLDHKKGGADLHDGRWLGFEGTDAEMSAELSNDKIKSLTISCLSSTGSWVFPPSEIEVWGSRDGSKFKSIGKWSNDPGKKNADGPLFISIPLKAKKMRFVKIRVRNYGKLPEGHPGAGKAAWLFIDELFFE